MAGQEMTQSEGIARLCSFLDLASSGKNDWWRYVLSIAAIMGLGYVLLVMSFVGAEEFGKLGLVQALADDPRNITRLPLTDQLFVFAFLLWSIIVFLLPFILFVPFIHRRPLRSYISNGPFKWASFRVSLGSTLIASIGFLVLALSVDPSAYEFNLTLGPWLAFAVLSLLLFPLQIFVEELVVRGYLMQMVGVATKNFLLRLMVPACVFAAMHYANEEVQIGGLWALATYLSMAIYLGLLVFWGDGLEYALGWHLGNNLFVALIASTADSTLPTPALFMGPVPDWSPWSIAQVWLALGAHFLVMAIWMRLAHGGREHLVHVN